MQPPDTRKTQRAATPNILVRISTKERFRHSYLKDLSEGGLFVKTDKPLPNGRAVSVDLLPPGWTEPLRLWGTVVRNGPGENPGMGIKFDQVDTDSLETLATLLSEYANGSQQPDSVVPTTRQPRGVDPLVEEVCNLKASLSQHQMDLDLERSKLADAQKRIIDLVAEVEASRGQIHSSGSEVAGRVERQLAERDATISELNTRVLEARGELEAFKEEVKVLERDDASSRKLAAALAKEKAALQQEIKVLGERLGKADQALEEKRALAARAEAAEAEVKRVEAQRLELARQSETTQAQLKLDLERSEQRVKVSDAENLQLSAKVRHFETELTHAKTEQQAAKERLAAVDQHYKEALEKLEKSKEKERELRELLAAVSNRDESPGLHLGNERDAESEPIESSPSVFISFTPEPPSLSQAVEALAAASPSPVPATEPRTPQRPASSQSAPDWADPDWGSMVGSDEPGGRSEELEVDVSVDDEPAPPAAAAAPPAAAATLPRVEFEAKLRRNQPLRRTGRFDTFEPRDDLERVAKTLLKDALHMSQLMVAGRGQITPPQLVEVLYALHTAGVVDYAEAA